MVTSAYHQSEVLVSTSIKQVSLFPSKMIRCVDRRVYDHFVAFNQFSRQLAIKKIRAVYLPCLSFNFSTVRPQDSLFFLSQ